MRTDQVHGPGCHAPTRRIPPLHFLYLLMLVWILGRSYSAAQYQHSFWPFMILVTTPRVLSGVSVLVWWRASADLRISWTVSVWTLLLCLVGFNIYLDSRVDGQETRIQRILREREKDPATLPTAVPQGFLTAVTPAGSFSLPDAKAGRFLPLADVTSTRTVYCREAGDYLVYLSDEKGFNNPHGIWSKGVDIALIGDSYVHGACVPQGSDIASQLRRRFPKTLNLGRGGNGPLSELAVLSEYAAPVKPKLVVWFQVDNDLHDLETERNSAILMHYLAVQDTLGLFQRTAEIDPIVRHYLETELKKKAGEGAPPEGSSLSRAIQKLVRTLSFSTLRNSLVFPHFSNHDIGLPSSDEYLNGLEWDLDRQVLAEAKKRVESWGGKMIVVIIPFQKGSGFLNPKSDAKARVYHDRLATMLRDLDLPYHDLNEDFHRLPNPNTYLADMRIYYGHDNERGYVLLADAVANFIWQFCETHPAFACGRS